MPPAGLLKHSCQFGVSLVVKNWTNQMGKTKLPTADLPGCFFACIPCYSLNSRFPLLLGYTTLTTINHHFFLDDSRFQMGCGWIPCHNLQKGRTIVGEGLGLAEFLKRAARPLRTHFIEKLSCCHDSKSQNIPDIANISLLTPKIWD